LSQLEPLIFELGRGKEDEGVHVSAIFAFFCGHPPLVGHSYGAYAEIALKSGQRFC
jgi:hypothetical protein